MSQNANLRLNPFTGSVSWSTITDEPHTISLDPEIGIYGFRLNEIPNPNQTGGIVITGITGGFTEISTGTPAPGEFRVDYGSITQGSTGFVWFNSAHNGVSALVDYQGGGSGNNTANILFAIESITGELSDLDTSDVSSLVAAINELASGSGIPFPRNHIAGLGISNNVSDVTNDIDIAVGEARDSTNAQNISLASALTKRLDAAWSVGTNQGGLDTGSIANAYYAVHVIKRPDTGVVDVLFSTSATSPTLPANYTVFRRIGWIWRESAAIRPFIQDPFDRDHFEWATPPTLDVDDSAPGTSAVTRTSSAPPNTTAHYNIRLTAGTNQNALYFSALDTIDVAASNTVAPLGQINLIAGGIGGSIMSVRLNSSRQFRSRVLDATGSESFRLASIGWTDRRIA